jgi:UV DNA damage repair endonuclease
MNPELHRIGFACKYLTDPAEVAGKRQAATDHNTRSTTVAWLNRQCRDDAVQRLWEIIQHNILATQKLVERVGTYDSSRRMVRIGSDILPMYTQSDWSWFYQQSDVRAYAEKHFAEVGRVARALDVRLSFHPGQYCVLASDNDNIVERSIDEFEYHVDMARWMGYGSGWHDHGFKINVHLSGRGGIEKFLRTFSRLSPEARNLITIENDEVSYGLDAVLPLAEHCALVLDIHHHWVKTGEYISPDDPRALRAIESWRGRRPVLHYSVSREDILVDHDPGVRPDLNLLVDRGFKKQQLRAHSDFYWNHAVNDWALTFWPYFDIMCESKAKNLASQSLLEHYNAKNQTVLTEHA